MARAEEETVPRDQVQDEYGLHFAEYLWFQRYSEDSFLSMVSHIAEIY